MIKERIEHFATTYDRAIYDLKEFEKELERKLEHLKKMANKHDVFIVYKDKNGNEWEARSYEDLQDCYSWGGISSKKFDSLENRLEEKQKYLKHSIQIPQIEAEIRMTKRIIDELIYSKEKGYPFV